MCVCVCVCVSMTPAETHKFIEKNFLDNEVMYAGVWMQNCKEADCRRSAHTQQSSLSPLLTHTQNKHIRLEVNITNLRLSGFILLTQVWLNNEFTLQQFWTAFYNIGHLGGNKAILFITLTAPLPLADCNIGDGGADSQAASADGINQLSVWNKTGRLK